jgi:hypothetical protein
VVTPEGHLVPFCLYNLTSASGATLYRGKQDAHHPPGDLDRR